MALLVGSLAHATEPSRISAALQPFVDRHELAGAVALVASKDKVLSLEAIGYSDIAANEPMATNAVFWIASMSKPITAAALMMLVDESKLRLDEPVTKYLPAFTPRMMQASADRTRVVFRAPTQPITLRYLLSHQSGLPFISSLETPTWDIYPLALRVQSYALTALNFEPGSNFSYSNAGINTAGRVIEVVSGMKFEEFLQQRLFGPLGMNDTTFWPNDAQLSRLAKSYKPNAEGTGLDETTITLLHYPLTDREYRFSMPAGGLFSTASDLAKFGQMLLNDGVAGGKRYISSAAIQEMTRDQRSSPKEEGYGLGWATHANGSYGHGGAYSTNMTVDPQHGLFLVWLVQHAGYPGAGAQSQAAFEKAALVPQ